MSDEYSGYVLDQSILSQLNCLGKSNSLSKETNQPREGHAALLALVRPNARVNSLSVVEHRWPARVDLKDHGTVRRIAPSA